MSAKVNGVTNLSHAPTFALILSINSSDAGGGIFWPLRVNTVSADAVAIFVE